MRLIGLIATIMLMYLFLLTEGELRFKKPDDHHWTMIKWSPAIKVFTSEGA